MMNRLSSTAVMARRVEPAASLDYFPTPPWATRAFCEHVMPALCLPSSRFDCEVLEPACGEGHMAVALAEYFARVRASDIHPYGFGEEADFLSHHAPCSVDWVITNPPFNLAMEFALHALNVARRGVALLVRTQFLEGSARHEKLFSRHAPQMVAQFVERVPMHRGRWEPAGSTATAYCWIAWVKHQPVTMWPTRFMWIPQSRKALTRHDDAMRFNAAAPVPLFGG